MSKIQEALSKLRTNEGDAEVRSRTDRTPGGTNARTRAAAEKLLSDEVGDYSHDVLLEFDKQALRDAGILPTEPHEKMLADQYRDIKRPLIANAYGKRVSKVEDGRLIMVTSAIPGEGKTFTSFNLAISIAQEQDIEVLLVDADVAKPHISEIMGISKMPGLLDLLNGPPRSPESLIVPTDQDGLFILPAGRPRANATELLSSLRMESVVHGLCDNQPGRVVIFDTPPILQTTESKAIAALVGQVVLVVRAESTSQGAVNQALLLLGDDKATNLVLNQSRSVSGNHGYGYQYGAYGSYGTSRPESSGTIWNAQEENKNEEE